MVKKAAYSITIAILLVAVVIPAIKANNAYAVRTQASTAASPKLNQGQEKTTTKEAKTKNLTVMEEARNKFKEGLAAIKNQTKQRAVVRIDERIIAINEDKTDKYIQVLDVLQIFLDRASEASTDAATLTNVTNAQDAIDTARAAVIVQSEKDYVMEITSEDALKANAGTVISQFRKDITAVYKLVHTAKLQVQKVYLNSKILKKGASESASI